MVIIRIQYLYNRLCKILLLWRQSLRREAETHAKEQVKIEEERKSVALALKEIGTGGFG